MNALALLCLAALPRQESRLLPAHSQVDRVTVYEGLALVERSFSVAVTSPGPALVVLSPLPAAAGEASFQVKVDSGPVVVQGLEMRQRSGELDEGDRERLRRRLEELRREQRELGTTRLEVEAGQRVLNAAVSAVEKSAELDLERVEALLELIGQQTRALDRRLIDYERRRLEVQDEIQDLELQLGGQVEAARPYRQAHVSLFFEQAGSATLRLSYLVEGASWRPLYDVRLDPDLTRVDVSLLGEVRQSSDEAWQDALLVLSTARPHVGLNPPELPRRFAGIREVPRYRRGESSAPAAAAEPLAELGYNADDGGGFAAVEKDAAVLRAPAVTVQDLGLTQQFQLPERVSLQSNGDPRTFPLASVPLEVRPERYVLPSLSEQAYVRAEVTSKSEAPLLPGAARVFLGPDFMGEAAFPLLRRGDSTILPLGVDPNLTVKYETLRDDRDDPGFLSDTVSLTRSFQVQLKLSAAAVNSAEVLVEEALPVSRDDRIKIKTFEMSPGAGESEEDLRDREEKGVWRWRFTLVPGQEREVRWGYVATFDEKFVPLFYDE